MEVLQFLLALFLLLYGGTMVLFGVHMWLYRASRKQIEAQQDFLLQQWRKPWF